MQITPYFASGFIIRISINLKKSGRMKVRIFTLLLLAGWLGATTANAIQGMGESGGNVRILLEKERCGTRSGSSTLVEAFISGEVLFIDISGYSGAVSVEVAGSGGGLQHGADIGGAGALTIDLSSLPAGDYMLYVTLDHTYSGSFER